jgi:hypothetical protein
LTAVNSLKDFAKHTILSLPETSLATEAGSSLARKFSMLSGRLGLAKKKSGLAIN